MLNLIIPKKLRFIEKTQESDDVFTLKFEKNNLYYRAGQHFLISLKHENPDDRGSMRVMSASSAPNEDFISFTTRYFGEDSSSFKKAFMKMQPGDKLTLRGPSPLFDVFKMDDKDYANPHVFIAGGIGITPFRSVLVDVDYKDYSLYGKLFYINRNDNFVFGEELQDMVEPMSEFFIKKIKDPEVLTKEMVQKVIDDFEDPITFKISGPMGFVDNYAEMLREMGIKRKYIKAYKYRGLGFDSYKKI